MLLSEKTVPYKTYVKQSLVEGLRQVFNGHVDDLLRATNTTIEFPNEEAKYPAIIVRFFEREIHNAGVGHYETLEINGLDYKFKHYFYTGDIEFAIHALSSLDRDLISDSLIQTIGMGDLTEYTNRLFERIYETDETEHPKAAYNYINLNTDSVAGFGETQVPAPWLPEDVLVYQTSYRVGIAGGFYSLPPADQAALGYIEQVDDYPYIKDLEEIPEGDPTDDGEWKP
jgi:hypothetical protein